MRGGERAGQLPFTLESPPKSPGSPTHRQDERGLDGRHDDRGEDGHLVAEVGEGQRKAERREGGVKTHEEADEDAVLHRS